MSLELQFKIKNNPNYLRYLRTHSNWYKELNRNPANFALFEEKVKEEYRLRPTDRISKALEMFEMAQAIISSLK